MDFEEFEPVIELGKPKEVLIMLATIFGTIIVVAVGAAFIYWK